MREVITNTCCITPTALPKRSTACCDIIILLQGPIDYAWWYHPCWNMWTSLEVSNSSQLDSSKPTSRYRFSATTRKFDMEPAKATWKRGAPNKVRKTNAYIIFSYTREILNKPKYVYIYVCVSYVNIAVLNKYLYFNICKRIIRAMFGFQIAYHGPSLHYPRAQSSPGHSTIFHLTTCQLPIRQIGVGPHEWEREPCTLAGSYNEFQLPKRYESQLGSSPGFEHQQL